MNFRDYDLIVFDVDGTLYYQNKLRRIMAGRLMGYYILHPHKIKDLLIIKKFREIREKAENTDTLYEDTASKLEVSKDRVEAVIKKWIYENPMDAVKKSADKELIGIIHQIQSENEKANELKSEDIQKTENEQQSENVIQIAIWSDYEADDKLKALGIECDNVYTAEQDRVGELKPSPKGIKLIMSDLNVSPDKTLMVGDRMVKDGEAAKAAGTDYLILSKKKSKRRKIYAEVRTPK